MASIDEVGEYLSLISDLNTLGSLCFPAMDGIRVCVGGVALRGHGGVSGDVGIDLLPLLTNLPLEPLSLYIYIYIYIYIYMKIKRLLYTLP